MSCPQTKLRSAGTVACLLILAGTEGRAQQPSACTAAETRLSAIISDRLTRSPLKGAIVYARWRDESERQRNAVSDSAGRTTLCIPQGRTVTLRSSYLDYAVDVPTVLSATTGAATYNAIIDVPGALVRGRVVDFQTGAPIARVLLRVRDSGLSALSDTTGRFVFERVPVGEYRLQTEHIAYAMNDAALRVGADDLDALIRLTPAAIALQPIVVTAFSQRLEHVGFYERRKRGVGTFFDRKQIDAMNIQDASDLLRRMPQLRLVPQLRRGANQQRNATVGRRGNCRFVFVIDGSRTLPDFEMDFVAAGALEGVEVYNGLAEVPASFKVNTTSVAGSTVCGVIAIWTRDSR